MNGTDGRRTVLPMSNPTGCFMKVVNTTVNDLGNYTCSITAVVQNDFDQGSMTIAVIQASTPVWIPIVIGTSIGILLALVIIFLCQRRKLDQPRQKCAEKADPQESLNMVLYNNSNGSIGNPSTDMPCQDESEVSSLLKLIQKKCSTSWLLE